MSECVCGVCVEFRASASEPKAAASETFSRSQVTKGTKYDVVVGAGGDGGKGNAGLGAKSDGKSGLDVNHSVPRDFIYRRSEV